MQTTNKYFRKKEGKKMHGIVTIAKELTAFNLVTYEVLELYFIHAIIIWLSNSSLRLSIGITFLWQPCNNTVILLSLEGYHLQ